VESGLESRVNEKKKKEKNAAIIATRRFQQRGGLARGCKLWNVR
jgi:hypothetical protein